MATSARQVATVPRSRLIIGVVAASLLAALVISGRIALDELLAYALVVGSVVLAGALTTAATRRQLAPAEGHLVPPTPTRIDVLGTLIAPALLILGGIGIFGWLRPLPVLPAGRRGRNGLVLRAFVTPSTHLVLIAISAMVFRATVGSSTTSLPWTAHGAYLLGYVNLWLLVLSLVPIPPQAGSVLLERLLPVSAWARYARVRPYLLKGAIGLVLASILLHVGLTDAVQRLLSGWWNAIVGA